MGNISSVLQFALENPDSADLKEIAYGIFHLNGFLFSTSGRITPLFADMPQLLNRVDDNTLRGYDIRIRLIHDARSIPQADVPRLAEEAKRYYRLAGDISGEGERPTSALNEALALYFHRSGDQTKAFQFCEAASDLAHKVGDNARLYSATSLMAVLKNTRGEFREGLALARSAQQFAAMVGNFRYETQGMKEEARAWVGLGNLAYGIEMCGQARKLVAAAGLEGSPAELALLDFEEDIQLKKTDYPASRAINEIIVRSTSVDNLVLFHANSLANIISIDVKLGVLTSEDAVTAGLERTRQLFTSRGIVADVLASSGKKFAAREMYEECIRKARGASAAVVSTSLQKLGDIRLGLCDLSSTVRWATVYFAFAKNTGSVLYIAWALRLLGDISRNQGDDETASTLLQVALDEFTRMEIYQGRGECLLGLADIADQRGDRAVALEYFSEARDMFEKSGLPFTLESSMFRT
ncbi:hypothetical protein B0H13DRAFT_1891083 [Mycena leptocephala]|nr:hypothetical protein B0H13DRAFT_1891083 [Mycena leptocephala]